MSEIEKQAIVVDSSQGLQITGSAYTWQFTFVKKSIFADGKSID